MYITDDPVADFDRYDAEQAAYEAKLPHCVYCGEPMWDDYYEIDGEVVCRDCLDEHFKRDASLLIID